MLAAFVTGFAEQASSMIDERNKEISDRALSEMEALIEKKAKADEAALKRRGELRKQAAELRAYKIPEQEIVGILENGYASATLERLKKAEVGTAGMKKLFTPFNPEDKRLVEDYIRTATTLTGSAPKAYLDEEGAFGLKTRAGTRVREAAARTTGVPLEELYKTELPEMGTEPTGTLDLGVLAEPKTTEKLKIKMRDIISRSEKTDQGILNFANEDDEKQFDTLRKQIEAAAIVKGLFSFEEEKPRTTSEINSILQRSLREGLDPYVIGGVAQVMQNGDVEPIIGDPEDIANFRKSKNSIIREIAINRGLLDPRTNKVLNRQAEDALTPYAIIEDGAVVGYKTYAPTKKQSGSTPPAPAARGATPEPAKKYTPEQLKTATIKAIRANPQNRAQLIKEYEDSTGLKFND
jgi:hypothetical protein